jgi:hypothetical protein
MTAAQFILDLFKIIFSVPLQAIKWGAFSIFACCAVCIIAILAPFAAIYFVATIFKKPEPVVPKKKTFGPSKFALEALKIFDKQS